MPGAGFIPDGGLRSAGSYPSPPCSWELPEAAVAQPCSGRSGHQETCVARRRRSLDHARLRDRHRSPCDPASHQNRDAAVERRLGQVRIAFEDHEIRPEHGKCDSHEFRMLQYFLRNTMQAAQFVQEVRFRRGMDLPTAARNLPRAAAETNRRVGWTPTVAGADGSAQRPPMLPGEDRSSGFRRQARASDWRDCPEPAGNGGRSARSSHPAILRRRRTGAALWRSANASEWCPRGAGPLQLRANGAHRAGRSE